MTERDEILDILQLSRYLRVPKSTLYALAAAGKIPCHKVGRHWRFRRQSVDRWLDRYDGDLADAGELRSGEREEAPLPGRKEAPL